MKKLMKKNQIIIAALAVMIAAAGYLNYSGMLITNENMKDTDTELVNKELLDISEEDIATSTEIASAEEGEVEGIPGEAVLTSGNVSSIAAQAKVAREQVRAKNKETLQAIIDDQNISQEQKNEAISKMVNMTTIAEQEVTIETLLASKGFVDAVVSLTDGTADIVVDESDLSDAKRAQIEDIVTRKTNIPAASIVITSIYNKGNEESN